MNNLFYELMYEKKTKRIMKILNVISKHSGLVTINDVVDALEVSKKTFLSDFEFLKKTLPKEYVLEERENIISLTSPSNKPIQDYILELAKSSFIFQLMDNILHNRILTIHDAEDAMYISESSIRKRLAFYNKRLEEFNVSLSTYNINLVGSEIDIRFFLHSFYTEFRQLVVLDQDLDQHSYNDIYDMIKTKMVAENVPIINNSYFKMSHWLLIADIRIHANCFVKIEDQHFKDTIMASDSFKELEAAYSKVYKNLPSDEVVWILITSLDAVIYDAHEKRLGMYRSDVILNTNEANVYKIIQKVAIPLKLGGDSGFTSVFFSYFKNLAQLTALSKVYQISSTATIELVKDRLPTLYKLWEKTLTNMSDELNFKIEFLEDVSASLALISSQFDYAALNKYNKIICSFSGEPGLNPYLQTAFKKFVKTGSEVVFLSNIRITSDVIEKEKADLVVTNFYLSDTTINIPTYRIPYAPSRKDWYKLEEFINMK
ncbi:MAG TPA: helix-turn-helix domain-containing protein [Candidatus Dorea intestinavium]|nr:helix-turn-helix domain-containing protein [Candidatus Dorea intestinavium]